MIDKTRILIVQPDQVFVAASGFFFMSVGVVRKSRFTDAKRKRLSEEAASLDSSLYCVSKRPSNQNSQETLQEKTPVTLFRFSYYEF